MHSRSHSPPCWRSPPSGCSWISWPGPGIRWLTGSSSLLSACSWAMRSACSDCPLVASPEPQRDRVGPRPAAEVLEEPVKVRPDGVRRYLQLRADLLVGQAESEEPNDLLLPRRQRSVRVLEQHARAQAMRNLMACHRTNYRLVLYSGPARYL